MKCWTLLRLGVLGITGCVYLANTRKHSLSTGFGLLQGILGHAYTMQMAQTRKWTFARFPSLFFPLLCLSFNKASGKCYPHPFPFHPAPFSVFTLCRRHK
ncbi:hypothetical protein GDO81_024714 [Engystomops pustulosus]|uniref:Secreted protein n=1 Tax=Engystomops pustulosus TaxID=76066 RepID=A0AAV6YJK1_ENGPU|nr:hypothetical protein GDO81_024714 [Engystomops pustulosus]